jgi:transcriptional antiterminator Rof (Rho-off)
VVTETVERVSFEVLPEREELESMELSLDRLSVLAEAAHDLGMVTEYVEIEEAAEDLALRLQARRAS